VNRFLGFNPEPFESGFELENLSQVYGSTKGGSENETEWEYVGARGRNLRFRKPSASSLPEAAISAGRRATQGPPTQAAFTTPALVTPPAEPTIQRTVYGWSRYKRRVEELPPEQRAVLKGVGDAIIASYRAGGPPVRAVKVYGHADYDTPRNPQREQQMSDERARMVTDWLKGYVGPAVAAQINWDTRGFGATELRAQPTTEASRRQNRRVEILVWQLVAQPLSEVVYFDSIQGRYFRSIRPAIPPSRIGQVGARASTGEIDQTEEFARFPLESGILGKDDRTLVRITRSVPHQFICKIFAFFGNDPDEPRAVVRPDGLTGVLISPRHVLTVGHALYGWVLGSKKIKAERKLALFVEVVPGFNSLEPIGHEEPFGSFIGLNWRVARKYQQFISSRRSSRWNACTDSDYGLITLDRPVSPDAGFWGDWNISGTIPIKGVAPSELRNAGVSLAGYPGDKCYDEPAKGSASEKDLSLDECGCLQVMTTPESICPRPAASSTQWIANGVVTSTRSELGPGAFEHNVDAPGGTSGSPIWMLTPLGYRLVGLNHCRPRGKGIKNYAIRISNEMLAELRSWGWTQQ
jgi:V8-like Glu-specific endopeptidase